MTHHYPWFHDPNYPIWTPPQYLWLRRIRSRLVPKHCIMGSVVAVRSVLGVGWFRRLYRLETGNPIAAHDPNTECAVHLLSDHPRLPDQLWLWRDRYWADAFPDPKISCIPLGSGFGLTDNLIPYQKQLLERMLLDYSRANQALRRRHEP